PALKLLQTDFAADLEAATALGEVIPHPLQAAHHASGRKIRAPDVLHQLGQGDIRVIDLGANPVDNLAEVVRRNVGGHAHGDSGTAVHQKVGEGGGKDGGLEFGLVVIGDKIDRILIHVLHYDGAECSKP